MKNLNILFSRCQADLVSLGYHPGSVTIAIDTRAAKRWGNCKSLGNGNYLVKISNRLLEDNVSDQAIMDTIMHELIHTIGGCMNHGKKWSTIAATVNQKLPAYTIKRCTTYEEKGIADHTQYAYAIGCTKCGAVYNRLRMSNLVKHPDKYTCGSCGGTLRRIK